MARQRPPEKRAASLSVDQMQSGIKKIERRIAELENFDVETIRERWDPLVETLHNKLNSTLQEVVGADSIEYDEYTVHSLDTLPLIMGGGRDPIDRVRNAYREGIERARMKLVALRDILLERIEDSEPAAAKPEAAKKSVQSTGRVFIVHGHDDGRKEAVARFVSKLDLKPIVLHEQPNEGKTVIEKFEAHAQVDFAIVLCTPDDFGYAASAPEAVRPRARQNVVLELGFFMAALGRDRVCALHAGDVELPSDYAGVLYLPMDSSGAWRFLLAREMKAAGMKVDLNLVG